MVKQFVAVLLYLSFVSGQALANPAAHMGDNAQQYINDAANRAASVAVDPYAGQKPDVQSLNNNASAGLIIPWEMILHHQRQTGIDPRFQGAENEQRGYSSPFQSIKFAKYADRATRGYDVTGRRLASISAQGYKLIEHGCIYMSAADLVLAKIMGIDPVQAARDSNKEQLRLGIIDVRQKMSEMLATKYPGSRYDCGSNTGSLVIGNSEYVYGGGRLQYYKESGAVNYLIQYTPGAIIASVTADKQGIGFVYNPNQPGASYYNDVNLQIGAASNMQMYVRPGAPLEAKAASLTKNELVKIVNDYYRANSSKGDMLSFTAALLTKPAVRDAMLNSYKLTGGQTKK